MNLADEFEKMFGGHMAKFERWDAFLVAGLFVVFFVIVFLYIKNKYFGG